MTKNLTTNVGNRFQEYCHRIGDAEPSQFEIYAAGYDQALADMRSADEPSSKSETSAQRTQVCDCDIGLCCKTNRRTNQYCRTEGKGDAT